MVRITRDSKPSPNPIVPVIISDGTQNGAVKGTYLAIESSL
jgi:hypothetical protein